MKKPKSSSVLLRPRTTVLRAAVVSAKIEGIDITEQQILDTLSKYESVFVQTLAMAKNRPY